MFEAVPKTGPLKGHLLDSTHYDEKRDGKELCCPDPRCKATLTYVKASLQQGNLFTRRSHFRTKAKHRQNCPEDLKDKAYKRHYNSLKRQITKSKNNIHIHLNMDTGDDLRRQHFNFVAGKSHNKNSIKSAKDLLRLIEDVAYIGGYEALDRIRLNYKGHKPVTLDEFFLNSTEATINLARNLCKKDSPTTKGKSHDRTTQEITHTAHPCLIKFTPKTRADINPQAITGTAITLNEGAASHLKMEMVLTPKTLEMTKTLSQSLNVGETYYIVATPQISITDAYQAFRNFKSDAPTNDTLRLHLPVNSAEQIMLAPKTPSPVAQAKITPTKPPQP